MIGAEPPPLQHRAGRAPGAVVLRGAATCRCAARRPVRRRRSTAISLEVRAGEIVGIAGVSGNGQQELHARALGRGPARARRGIDPAVRAATSRRAAPRARRALGLHFVPEERLGRGAVPTLALAQNMLLTRTRRRRRAAAGSAPATSRQLAERASSSASTSRPAGPDAAAQQPVGRQPAEVHRRPRDRRRPEAADRLAADLGRRRRRRGADPRRAARAARRRLRGAGGQRGARRAVRDLRPAAS